METIIKRKVDRLGRIVLPKEICRLNGIREGTLLSIERDGVGNIILKKAAKQCIFCGGQEALGEENGKPICWKCVKKIINKWGKADGNN